MNGPSSNALEELEHLVKNTTDILELQSKQGDKRIDSWAPNAGSKAGVATEITDQIDERHTMETCLPICEKARSYLEVARHPSGVLGVSFTQGSVTPRDAFEAQALTPTTMMDIKCTRGCTAARKCPAHDGFEYPYPSHIAQRLV